MREPQVVETAIAYPAACACGSGAGPLIDTMISNHQGRLYVCVRCLTKWAALLGFLTPAEAQEQRDTILSHIAINDALELSLAEAEAGKVVRIDDLADEIRRRTAGTAGAAA